MAIFGSSHKSSSAKNSSPLSFNTLTATTSAKSLQNISLNSPILSSHQQPSSVKLTIKIESPPIVLYGNPTESSGSLLSGLLKLEILLKAHALSSTLSNNGGVVGTALSAVRSNPVDTNDTIRIHSVQLSLNQTIHYGKPFLPPSNTLQSCSDCKMRQTELARWDVLTDPTDFIRGTEHGYPFSHLIPGSLPQTTLLSNLNTVINYELVAKVVLNKGKKHDDLIELKLPIIVKRSILRGPDRNSLRVFPPTDVTASAVLPNVLYPKSSFPIELKMENICTKDRRWRMRKLNWRLEENIKVKANSCDAHKFKLKVVEDHTRKLNNQTSAIASAAKKKKTAAATAAANAANANAAANATAAASSSSASHPPQSTEPPNLGISPVQTQTPGAVDRSLRNQLDDLLENDSPRRPIMSDSNHNDMYQEPEVETEDAVAEQVPEQAHALFLEETRTISHGEIKSGWKSDFSNHGRIELVAEISLVNLSTIGLSSALNNLNSIDSGNSAAPHYNIRNLLNNVNSNCSCDLYDDTLGVYVSHILIVELVVAEELLQGSTQSATHQRAAAAARAKDNRLAEVSPAFANTSTNTSTGTGSSSSNPMKTSGSDASKTSPDNKIGIPTGAARVLRMQFKVILTERSGLGIAWDDEVPPTYHDVRLLSPPTYDQTLDVAMFADVDATPSLDALSYPAPAVVVPPHRTPGVLYGGGDTPGATFSNVDLNEANAAELENFQELRI